MKYKITLLHNKSHEITADHWKSDGNLITFFNIEKDKQVEIMIFSIYNLLWIEPIKKPYVRS